MIILLITAIGFIFLIILLQLYTQKKTTNSIHTLIHEKEQISFKFAHAQEINCELKNKLNTIEEHLKIAGEKIVALETEKTILKEQRKNNLQQLEEIQNTMKLQFENLAHKIFNENSKNFKQESTLRLSEILSPLKLDIENFKTKFEHSCNEQIKQQFSITAEIQRIVKVNEQMTSQTVNLTNALKGDFRTQGHWGEFVLERILEESGLRLGEDYILQGAQMNVKHIAKDNRLKPDVIINLPEDKHIIIDAKVSLTNYEQYHSESDEGQKSLHLKRFIESVKHHIDDLQEKRYQDAEQLKSPDFVLMFMPIEAAYCLATKHDKELHYYAWNKKIILVCPTTLYSTLRTIASIWKIELQKKHSEEIAKQGAALYEKVFNFIEDMQDLDKHLKKAQISYDNAMKKLATGKGNILVKTQRLEKLGVKSSKTLLKLIPEAFNEDEETDIDNLIN